MSLIAFHTGTMARGARWHTTKERKPWNGKRYMCGYCGKRGRLPYRWVDGMKSCHECNERFDKP